MNPKNSKLTEARELAAVGIGTMIVFIATVLVAAIAAGVLIDMSNRLQSTSEKTGTEAQQEVASNVQIDKVVGKRNATTGTIAEVEVFIKLAAGASAVDMAAALVQLQTSDDIFTYSHSDTALGSLGSSNFNVTEERDSDNSFTSAAPVMTSGDYIRIELNLSAGEREMTTNNDYSLFIVPESGSAATSSWSTPSSFRTDLTIVLR